MLTVLLTASPAQAAFPGQNGRIAYTSIDWDWELRDVWVMNPDGSAKMNLTHHPAQDFAPAFSPDGTRIAFASDRDGDQNIYLMNGDGSGQAALTTAPGRDTNPAFSADGTTIAFTSDRDGNRELYVVGVDGSGETRLTTSYADEDDAAFSADGALLAYSTDADGDREIHVMGPDGSNPVRLTDNAAEDSQPTFSPDGSSIAFTSDRDGGIRQIFRMGTDGSGQVRVTADGASQHRYEPAFSPDGTRLALTSEFYCPPSYYCAAMSFGGIRVRSADGAQESLLDDNTYMNSEPDWGVAGANTPPPPLPADTSPPETAITTGPAGFTNDTTPTFAFTAYDAVSPAGALRYALRVDDGAWSSFTAETSATLGGTVGLSQGAHAFAVTTRDEAGNEDPTPATRSFFVDSVAPTGSVAINGGASRVRTQSITLTLSARDPAPASGVAQMRIANSESALPGVAWRNYATNAAWTMTPGAGTKTVYVQFRDAAGNVSATARASTTYKP